MTGERMLHGVGVAPGITIGRAQVIRWELPPVTREVVTADEVPGELVRLQGAIGAVRSLLAELQERTRDRAGAEEAKIFDAQILMLEDPDFLRDVETLIRRNQLSAERAFEFKTLEMHALWAQSSNFRLRQRVADLSGLQIRVLNELVGTSVQAVVNGGDHRPVVVFTRELTPGLTVQLEREQVAGLASVEGARTAHAAILARSLGIPCVMGVVDGLERVVDGADVILDGTHGFILVHPTPDEVKQARENEHLRRELEGRLAAAVGQPSITADGTRVTLRGNVDMPEELHHTAQLGAEGVGLLRTEFLVLGRTGMPSEGEQATYFERVAREFPDHPVVVRTYDLGGDKFPAAFQAAPEANPFLGWRAIRVCLDQPDLFITQIRAALRARAVGDVRLMLPMISQLEEIEQARAMVVEAGRALAREGVPAAETIPVGVMIETPAAALQADEVTALADFVSVGTNDLTQYTLAVDRGNARLAGRFAPHHPAVLQLLARIVAASRRTGAEASVCGEMASDPISAFLLLGLGYRVLSVAPPALPLIRWLVRQVEVSAAAEAVGRALRAATTAEVDRILEDAIARYVDVQLLRAGRLPGMLGAARLRSFISTRP